LCSKTCARRTRTKQFVAHVIFFQLISQISLSGENFIVFPNEGYPSKTLATLYADGGTLYSIGFVFSITNGLYVFLKKVICPDGWSSLKYILKLYKLESK